MIFIGTIMKAVKDCHETGAEWQDKDGWKLRISAGLVQKTDPDGEHWPLAIGDFEATWTRVKPGSMPLKIMSEKGIREERKLMTESVGVADTALALYELVPLVKDFLEVLYNPSPGGGKRVALEAKLIELGLWERPG